MEVARTGNSDAAKALLKAGADVNAKEAWGGQSPLMWAAAQSQPEMIKLLLGNGADVNARGLVREWQRKVIKEPRPKDMNNGGFTPLLYAAREGCTECAKALVAGGADLNLPDPQRVTPLVLALLNLHFDVASYLIEAGADVNKWDLYGRTPLYMAADTSTLPVMGNGGMVVLPSMDKLTALDVAKELLDKGADPNIQLKRRPPYRNVPQDRGGDGILSQGATPLLRAARAGDAEFVELLLQHGALVDLPSNQGVTPLMAAAGLEYGLRVTRGRNRTMDGVLKTMQLLLDAGADVNARELAEPKGDAAAHQLVIEQRLSDYSYDYRGRQVPSPRAMPHRTALHGAAMKGFDPIVEFLAAHGADLYAKDANGRTALDLAMGDYNEPFLRQKAEPHTETAALLKTLMAANPAEGRERRSNGARRRRRRRQVKPALADRTPAADRRARAPLDLRRLRQQPAGHDRRPRRRVPVRQSASRAHRGALSCRCGISRPLAARDGQPVRARRHRRHGEDLQARRARDRKRQRGA